MKCSFFSKTRNPRIYLTGVGEKTYVELKPNGKISVSTSSTVDKKQIIEDVKKHLDTHLLMIPITPALLLSAMKALPELPGYQSGNGFASFQPKPKVNDNVGARRIKGPLTLESLPMKTSTSQNIRLSVDHREPELLKTLIGQLPIDSISVDALLIGDVHAVCKKTGAELIIERKSLPDFSVSIRSDEHRAHSQVERLYAYKKGKEAQGTPVKIIWIAEGEDGLYSVLPKTNQMAGWVSYQCAISDQYIVESFSMEHTAYLVGKFIQGFFERELFKKVRVGGKRIDSKKPLKTESLNHAEPAERGVSYAQNLRNFLIYIPGLNRKSADALVNAGLSLKDITALSVKDLQAINGIGKASAEKVFNFINSPQ